MRDESYLHLGLKEIYCNDTEEDKELIERYSCERAEKGLAACDTFNFDTFLLGIIIRGLRQLAQTSHGYPGREPYDTHKKWRDCLKSLADRFEEGYKLFYGDSGDYIQLSSSKEAEGLEILKESFHKLADILPDLWD